jgi:hypothetical protein
MNIELKIVSASSGVPDGPTTRRAWCFHQVQTAECVTYLVKSKNKAAISDLYLAFQRTVTPIRGTNAKSRQSGLLSITSTLRRATHSAVGAW